MIAEIYCDKVPKTGENFIELCEKKFYNNLTFHRLIKNFMVKTKYILLILLLTEIRYKEETLMEMEKGDNHIMEINLKMNFILN